MKTYYPKIQIETDGDEVRYKTCVRKKYKGIYYDACFTRIDYINEFNSACNSLNKFHEFIYHQIHAWKFTKQNAETFDKSDIQISEQDRLKMKSPFI